MRRFTQLCLTLSLASFATSTLAAEAGEFYVAPGVQWMNFDETTGYDTDSSYFLGFGYNLTDRFSLELSTFDLDAALPNGSELDLDHWKVDGLYDLDWDMGSFTPFVLAGIGNTKFGGENETTLDYGAGLRLKLSDRVEWRTAVRSFHYTGRDREDSDLGIDSSIVIYLGKRDTPRSSSRASRPAAAPAAPATAAREEPAAPAARIADADRDGVADARDNCPNTPRNYAVDANGCPIPVEEVARVELMVNFDFDRSEVQSEYFDEIKEVTDFMQQHPDVIIELEGHTDSRGTEVYNQGLSERRAAAVRQVMLDRFNIAGSRVSSRGFGESQPVASNDSDAGRADNRRVMTVIIKTLQDYRPR